MTKTPAGVQSVTRTFEILEHITASEEHLSLSEIAEAVEIPLPTTHRILQALTAMGYVRQVSGRRYGLGPRFIIMGEVAGRQLGAAAQPRLAQLAEQLGETANMAILDTDMAMYVAQVPSSRSMRMFTEVGRRVHLHATGVGKAILAQLDDLHVKSIVERAGMPSPTPNSLASLEDLLAELQTTRSRGYALDDNEQEIGVRCLAVAVPQAPNPSAISVSGPVTRVDGAFAERAVPLLQQVAREISQDINS
ncbi:IclR family transcriptional regulator [Nesterenkonia sp.]|uniref:IclR family transcriptional regulator n=1 Tax=Nesterenkonia sp. TaxID=704201 RepID=UPI00260A9F3A|nr:IclR family transcriptional regulator [Nesterenkonia sp.]